MGAWVRILAGADLKRADHVQWGMPLLQSGYKAGLPHTIGGLTTLFRMQNSQWKYCTT